MASESPPLATSDLELLERVAARVVAMRLEVPAILALEGSLPLSFVAGQTLVFFEPLLQVFLPGPQVGRFARLVERRDALEHLVRRIEVLAEHRPKGGPARPARPPRGAR